MIEMTGPVGFQHIETAPRDGRFVRLRFRRREDEVLGGWKHEPHMKAGGFWSTIDGYYITPGPIFWAPATLPRLPQETEHG